MILILKTRLLVFQLFHSKEYRNSKSSKQELSLIVHKGKKESKKQTNLYLAGACEGRTWIVHREIIISNEAFSKEVVKGVDNLLIFFFKVKSLLL